MKCQVRIWTRVSPFPAQPSNRYSYAGCQGSTLIIANNTVMNNNYVTKLKEGFHPVRKRYGNNKENGRGLILLPILNLHTLYSGGCSELECRGGSVWTSCWATARISAELILWVTVGIQKMRRFPAFVLNVISGCFHATHLVHLESGINPGCWNYLPLENCGNCND